MAKTVRELFVEGVFEPKYPDEPPAPDNTAWHEAWNAYSTECTRLCKESRVVLLAALAAEHGLTDHPKLKLLDEIVLDFSIPATTDEIIDTYERISVLIK